MGTLAMNAAAGVSYGACVLRWLRPLRTAVPELTDSDWTGLEDFEAALRRRVEHLVQETDGQPGRAHGLLATRRHLVRLTEAGDSDAGRPQHPSAQLEAGVRRDLRQMLRQTVCGFYDLDQRDASGPGHGWMILRHATPTCWARWSPRLRAGDLAGIAMTEAVGGSQVRAITTAIVAAVGGEWRLTGEKRWISRLQEAAVFVVFARTPADTITAVVLDATDPRITRHPEHPTGLSGWSWGRLSFDAVPIANHDLLTPIVPGADALDGLALFNDHFAYYRPLVTATALGAAAAVHDTVAGHLARRERLGEIDRVHDHALITIGRTHAQITAGMLAALHSQRLAATSHPHASLWGRTTKALGVDLARATADQLSVLIGASGFTFGHQVQKARRDLDALRYADGMHDSLNRSVGRALLSAAPVPPAYDGDDSHVAATHPCRHDPGNGDARVKRRRA